MKSFKELAHRDKPAYGAYIGDTGATVAEIAACAGFDFLRVDCEHTMAGCEHLKSIIRIADGEGLPTLVRISSLDDISRLLDFGASGILIPSVSTPEQVRDAVMRCKYAPLGQRGISNISRVVRYGDITLSKQLAKANDEVCLAVQIETAEGVENIDAILDVEGIDIVTVGAQDLSQSMGVAGQSKHPSVLAAQDMVVHKALERGLLPLVTASTPQQAKAYAEQGVLLQNICFDTNFIWQQFKTLLATYRE